MSGKKGGLETTKDLIEISGKAILAILALYYGLGLLVVNIYLSRYGVHSLSLFRLHYILAGFWVMAPIFVAMLGLSILLAGAYSIPTIRDHIHDWAGSSFSGEIDKPIKKSSVVFFLIEFFLSTIGFIAVIVALRIKFTRDWIISLPAGLGIVIVITLLIVAFYRYKSALRIPFLYGTSIGTLFYFSIYTFVFANVLYGTIPAHLGGGQASDVQLLLKVEDKEKEFFEISGLTFRAGTSQTDTVKLLFADENGYVILVKSQSFPQANWSTLSIKKDIAEAVLYQGFQEWSFGSSDSF